MPYQQFPQPAADSITVLQWITHDFANLKAARRGFNNSSPMDNTWLFESEGTGFESRRHSFPKTHVTIPQVKLIDSIVPSKWKFHVVVSCQTSCQIQTNTKGIASPSWHLYTTKTSQRPQQTCRRSNLRRVTLTRKLTGCYVDKD